MTIGYHIVTQNKIGAPIKEITNIKGSNNRKHKKKAGTRVVQQSLARVTVKGTAPNKPITTDNNIPIAKNANATKNSTGMSNIRDIG